MADALKVEIKQTQPALVAFIQVKGHFNQIPAAFGKLYTWISSKGYKPVGLPTAVYYKAGENMPPEEFEWELRSQIAGNVKEAAADEQGLGVKRTAAGQAASTTHKGPYEKLGGAYQALTAWVEKNGYRISGPPEELYLNSPEQVPPAELLTEIRFPVSRK